MKTRDNFIIRLLQESSFNVKVLIQDTKGDIYPIQAVRQTTISVQKISEDMLGPLAHNEEVLIIEAGLPIKQEVKIR